MTIKNKLEKLDNAFLFLISFVGIIFSIVQIYAKGLMGFIEILPLLFLGMLLPFYIGYLKGSIAVDSIAERARGWIYLMIGISAYFAFFTPDKIAGKYGLSFIPYSFCIFVGSIFTYYILKWLNKVFGIGREISHQCAYLGTAISAFLLAFTIRMIIKTYSNFIEYLQARNIPSTIPIIIGALSVSLVFEKISEDIVDANLPLSEKETRIIKK